MHHIKEHYGSSQFTMKKCKSYGLSRERPSVSESLRTSIPEPFRFLFVFACWVLSHRCLGLISGSPHQGLLLLGPQGTLNDAGDLTQGCGLQDCITSLAIFPSMNLGTFWIYIALYSYSHGVSLPLYISVYALYHSTTLLF